MQSIVSSSLTQSTSWQLACATSHGFALIEEGSSLKHLSQPIPTGFQPYTRFNDGACDRHGRFVAGTLFHPERGVPGQLYIYDPELDTCKVLEPGPFTVRSMLNPCLSADLAVPQPGQQRAGLDGRGQNHVGTRPLLPRRPRI